MKDSRTLRMGARVLLLLVPGMATLLHVAKADPLSFTQISAGKSHTCAVDALGGVECWGWGRYGQVGNGSDTARSVPTSVSGISSFATRVRAGSYHSCAIVGGGVQCWGLNGSGQLGDGSTDIAYVPVPVVGLDQNVSDVASGGMSSCAIVAGSAMCWGDNTFGELGNGSISTMPSLVPQQVTGLTSGVTSVTLADTFACAVVNGGAKCWGRNDEGELGNGNTTSSSTPVDVVGLSSGVSAVSAHGKVACAIANGGVKCWGTGYYGELGDGNSISSSTPVDVTGLSRGVSEISAGDAFVCALRRTTAVLCWGGNGYGSLGYGGYQGSLIPVSAAIVGPGLHSLTTGGGQACVIVQGQAHCWGYNVNGQLGLGTSSESTDVPVNVIGMQDGATLVAASWTDACAIRNGTASCWGSNETGQIGDGTYTLRSTPVAVASLGTNVTAIAPNPSHSCAIAQGAAYCWGGSILGNGSFYESTTPVGVTGLDSNVTSIATGRAHACAIKNGAVMCWGYDTVGQLGDGYAHTYELAPVQVLGLSSGASTVTAGLAHSCAIVAGAAKCWGDNFDGEIGNGTTSAAITSPVGVLGMDSGVSQIVASDRYTCAIQNGGVWCWGKNDFGRLGTGDYADSATPASVVGLSSGASSISLGIYHACAILVDGRVECWGLNTSGELGSIVASFGSSSATPIDATTLPANVSQLALGQSSTCGIADGSVFCVGWNDYGQLGNGSVPYIFTPMPVVQNDGIFTNGFDSAGVQTPWSNAD
ncbi:MAG: hypothetical protein ABIW82_13875 [Dokdonella sp.]